VFFISFHFVVSQKGKHCNNEDDCHNQNSVSNSAHFPDQFSNFVALLGGHCITIVGILIFKLFIRYVKMTMRLYGVADHRPGLIEIEA